MIHSDFNSSALLISTFAVVSRNMISTSSTGSPGSPSTGSTGSTGSPTGTGVLVLD